MSGRRGISRPGQQQGNFPQSAEQSGADRTRVQPRPRFGRRRALNHSGIGDDRLNPARPARLGFVAEKACHGHGRGCARQYSERSEAPGEPGLGYNYLYLSKGGNIRWYPNGNSQNMRPGQNEEASFLGSLKVEGHDQRKAVKDFFGTKGIRLEGQSRGEGPKKKGVYNDNVFYATITPPPCW